MVNQKFCSSLNLCIIIFPLWRIAIGVGIRKIRLPQSPGSNGWHFILAAQISSQRMSAFQKQNPRRFTGVLFIVTQSIPEITTEKPHLHVQNIRMSIDDKKCQKTLLYEKTGKYQKARPNLIDAQGQNFSSFCVRTKIQKTSAKLQSKDKIFSWDGTIHSADIFFQKLNLPEEEYLFCFNPTNHIYLCNTTQVSEYFVQDILPQAPMKLCVVSFYLNDQTLFQDWFVWYPKGITTTKQTSSLFEHHDIIQIFNFLPHNYNFKTPMIDAMYGNPFDPLSTDSNQTPTSLHVWSETIFCHRQNTSHHIAQPFFQKMFETLQHIVAQTEQLYVTFGFICPLFYLPFGFTCPWPTLGVIFRGFNLPPLHEGLLAFVSKL